MATFMLNEREMIRICATKISMDGDYISAWMNDKQVAIFKASEVVGCWLEEERKVHDGKVY
jgi:hypothetical protein